MGIRGFNRLLLGSIVLMGLVLDHPGVSFAACDQTVSPGANVAAAIASAAGGTTVCLSSGSHGSVSLSNLVKTSEVSVQSVSGTSATLSLAISGSQRFKFQNLTISALNISGASKHITVSDSKFTGQALLNMGSNGSANILIDGNTFNGISVCSSCYEGRLHILGSSNPSGVTVSNNHFGGPGDSDGIHTGAPGVVIGPGNVFDGLVYQGNRHVDAIQLDGNYGNSLVITGNYFLNGGSYIMAPDGGQDETIVNNVFVVGDYYPAIQLGSHRNDTFVHNTSIGVGVNIDNKSGSPASSNATVRDNIMIDASFNLNCTGCTITHNLFSRSENAKGTNNLIGTPTFIGGSDPGTWVHYQLATGSLGYQAASDGKDMGANSFGPETSAPPSRPAAPTSLRVN